MKKILMLSMAGVVLSGPAFAEHGADDGVHKAGGSWFEKIDANHDGAVSKEEFMAKHEARFMESDTDKDGKITKAEADSQKQKWMAEREKRREERKQRLEQKKAVKTETEKKAE